MSDFRKYGMIVVGSGITGLSSGLTWAMNNDIKEEPVLIIEKEPKTGGYVTSYEREGYLFETCQTIPNISELLEFFEVVRIADELGREIANPRESRKILKL